MTDWKRCTKCKRELPLDKFGNDKRTICGKKAACRECYAGLEKDYYKRTRDIQLKKFIEYGKKNRAWRTKYNKEYYAEHKEELNKKSIQYHHEHSEKIYELNARRRARELNAPGDGIKPGEWEEIVHYYGGHCIYPGCTEAKVTKDHITPLFLGGSHDIYNIQPLCQRHNSSKGTKIIDYRFISDWT